MTEKYYTIAGKGEAELTEKKSRFIAYVMPVTTQEQAAEEIERIRSKHWDARHNVYAYTLLEGQIKRYSDDNEPSGTAGIPILNILEKEGLQNTLVVVTRYFGGILLGTGGLARAYSQAAKMGVTNAGIIERCLCDVLSISCAYNLFGKIQNYILNCHDAMLKEVLYTDSVSVCVHHKTGGTKGFVSALVDLTDKQAEICCNGQIYEDFGKIGED